MKWILVFAFLLVGCGLVKKEAPNVFRHQSYWPLCDGWREHYDDYKPFKCVDFVYKEYEVQQLRSANPKSFLEVPDEAELYERNGNVYWRWREEIVEQRKHGDYIGTSTWSPLSSCNGEECDLPKKNLKKPTIVYDGMPTDRKRKK